MEGLFREENEELQERYELSVDRINRILDEDTVAVPYSMYFKTVSNFIEQLHQVQEQISNREFERYTLVELQKMNHDLYNDILPVNYETSYANPAYTVGQFGTEIGSCLSFLYAEIRSVIPRIYEQRLFDITVITELFIEVYNYFEEYAPAGKVIDETGKEQLITGIKEAIYYYAHDYSEILLELKTRELLDPTYNFAENIIMESDLSDLRYLYRFGEYITENEIKIAQFLNQMSEEEVRAMSFTYTDGYTRGFQVMGADFSKKSIVSIRYCIGFERMMKYAFQNFYKLNKRLTVIRNPIDTVNKAPGRKIGYYTTSPNPQYEYDHRFDNAIYFDSKFKEHKLDCVKNAWEKYKPEAEQYAGPAVLETFGEEDFLPSIKPEACKLTKAQEKLITEYKRDAGILSMDYIKQEETSFTIIAYPLPSIGNQFNEIFAETVKVNTLNNDEYHEIQQCIIDALDTGSHVIVKGCKDNRTNLTIMLHELADPSSQTNFENCTADVNIPVGEVFTSPVLSGTKGTLHVSKVFLNGLEYQNLDMEFAEGKVTSYTCTNFNSDEENKAYLKENVMMNQETLAIGEFAIGTNTTAYAMGQKFSIQNKLPILIAEKTGPHFAIGDTCYHMSEDHKVYNRNGKEIIARDNEVSILRKTDLEKAYYNCHTDITIPYNEIGLIAVCGTDGSQIDIIKDGRFVLKGTESLNEALSNL